MPAGGRPAPNAHDLAGRTFGRLRVLGRAGTDHHGASLWRCLCDPDLGGCGAEPPPLQGGRLTGGHVESCGCLRADAQRASPEFRRAVSRLTARVWQRACRVCGGGFVGTARAVYCRRPPCVTAANGWKRAAGLANT